MTNTQTSHERLLELLPLAVLAKLEPDEEQELTAHLEEGCEQCEEQLRTLRNTVGAAEDDGNDRGRGPRASTGVAPFPERPRQAVGFAMRDGGDAEGWDRQRRLWRATIALGVFTLLIGARTVWGSVRIWRLALLIALGLMGVLGYSLNQMAATTEERMADMERQAGVLHNQIGSLTEDLSRASEGAEALDGQLDAEKELTRALLNPDLQQTQLKALAPAPGATGFVIISPGNNSAVFSAEGLPPTAATRTYQLWWITSDQGPLRAATFSGVEGKEAIVLVSLPETKERLLGCAVTLESAGGAEKPTGAMYLRADFS